MNEVSRLSRTQEYSLAVAAAVVTANAYYIHPIIGDVAAHRLASEARSRIVQIMPRA